MKNTKSGSIDGKIKGKEGPGCAITKGYLKSGNWIRKQVREQVYGASTQPGNAKDGMRMGFLPGDEQSHPCKRSS